ncbi:hypothetical protein B0J13DRAFT_615457 [Dactylonectria estremocensis]|uniref:Fibroin-3 n=1 Tax=Dactylonectria estremocensis TaxID=1079267 RepID=A0A9P9FKQ9_9HYPO|nr:hypothetical protein B0J13DRAFT_615457 [Dactylonectria estremocensis]
MPSIDVAMARSLRGSNWEVLKNLVARSVAAELSRRSVVDDATDKASDVATTFSSWDNCMEKAYCKWPVIAIIAIGGLIIFSVVWLLRRLLRLLRPPGGHKQKHLDDRYAPTTNHEYRSEPPMNPTFPPATGVQSSGIQSTAPQFASSAHHVRNEPPQYAEFETSNKRGDEDSLPEMPSWQGAGSKKVALDDDVEMDQLKKSPVPDQKSTFMNNGTPSVMPQGRSPYGQQQQGNHSGYFNQNGPSPDPYSPIDKGYGYNSNPGDGYGHDQSYAAVGMGAQAQNAYGQAPIDQGYGQSHNDYGNHDGYSNAAQGYGMRHSPAPRGTPAPQNDYDGYGAQVPHSRSPVHQNTYDEHNQHARRTPAPQDDYGYGQAARRTPAPQDNYGYDQHARRTPAPQGDYGYDQSARRTPAPRGDNGYGQSAQRTPAPQDEVGYGQHAAYNNQGTHSPAPEAHYGPRPVPQRQYAQQDPPQSPINNNSGFDFNSGYARPQQSPTKESYPGYKAYQP